MSSFPFAGKPDDTKSDILSIAEAERARGSRRHILRLRGQGRKTLRSGHAILDESGRAVGRVTSFAYVHEDMTFIVLACVEESFQPAPGSLVRLRQTQPTPVIQVGHTELDIDAQAAQEIFVRRHVSIQKEHNP